LLPVRCGGNLLLLLLVASVFLFALLLVLQVVLSQRGFSLVVREPPTTP
jgi:hypothetical protein